MTPTIATISGVPVIGTGVIRWGFTQGVEPQIRNFEIDPKNKEQLLRIAQGRGSVVLSIQSGGKAREIKELFVIGFPPSDNPNITQVTLTDRRWMWRGHVIRSYNVRKHIGFKRILSPAAELADVVADVWYHRYSLRNEEDPWTVPEMIEDIFSATIEREIEYRGSSAGHDTSTLFRESRFNIRIEDLEIDDPAPQALQRALGYLPDVSLYVDDDGRVIFYNKVGAGESSMVSIAGPEIAGAGHIGLIENEILCPSEVEVIFTIESELRFEFVEEESGGTAPELTYEKRLENVLPIPDYNLEIGGDTFPQGTYARFSDVLPAWGSAPGIGEITQEIIQRAFVPYVDFWASLRITGVLDPINDWPSRISAIQRHYRQTLRMNQIWRDRILSFRANRVSIVDTETGSRAPSEAYADFAVLGSERFWQKSFQDGTVSGIGGEGNLAYAINVSGYPTGDGNSDTPSAPSLNTETRPGPIRVTVQDHDQGILHLEYLVDPTRVFEQVLPSKIENVPTGDSTLVGQRTGTSITFDAMVEGRPVGTFPKLEGEHRIAILLTATPSPRQGRAQTFSLRVKPDDVRQMIPRLPLNPRGPRMTARVGPGVATAIVKWDDQRADDINKIFGVSGNAPTHQIPDLRELVLNADPNFLGREGAALNHIAQAVAARIYATFADRLQGSAAFQINDRLRPAGWISDIEVEVNANGVGLTKIVLPESIPQLPFDSLLPASVRRIVNREAQK